MYFYLFFTIFFALGSVYCQEEFDGTLTSSYVNYFFNNSETNVGLSGREISSIDAGAFRNFDEIKRLDLSNNAIETLGDTIFLDQSKLEELDLSNNRLLDINRASLRGLNQLRLLLLENNKIIQVEQKTFVGLPSLKTVCLFGNPVSIMFPGSLQQLSAFNAGLVVSYTQSCATTTTASTTTTPTTPATLKPYGKAF